MIDTSFTWHSANAEYLNLAIADLHTELESRSGDENRDRNLEPITEKMRDVAEKMDCPPALETLVDTFDLSRFEKNILLLCAAVQLDGGLADYCRQALDGAPLSFGFALSTLEGVHWSAISPESPLRYWHLIECADNRELASSPLSIDERILHYLVGVDHLDQRIEPLVEPFSSSGPLIRSHAEFAERSAALLLRNREDPHLPVVQLCGDDGDAIRNAAAAICAETDSVPYVMQAYAVSSNPRELNLLHRLWTREVALSSRGLLVEWGDAHFGNQQQDAVIQLLEALPGTVILGTRERRALKRRQLVSFELPRPDFEERRSFWNEALGPLSGRLDGYVDDIAGQYTLGPSSINVVCEDALAVLARQNPDFLEEPDGEELYAQLWRGCRSHSRPRLSELAQLLNSVATWDDLILGDSAKKTLKEISLHVKHRTRVYEQFGVARKTARGLGISALFYGPSGTGKTMAAEVLARELDLDLFRIDLSQVVNKYVGETEKNLGRVFDAAENGGSILLFDEADALFGKRSEVKDSHDRYANIEVSYLLQRMEEYGGLAILTTNRKEALDHAFLRRIRFAVNFSFPDTRLRRQIWEGVFPLEMPLGDIDINKLSRLNAAGGNIRNMAIYSSFLAADEDTPVNMKHLLRAARVEFQKIGKALTDSDIGDWV